MEKEQILNKIEEYKKAKEQIVASLNQMTANLHACSGAILALETLLNTTEIKVEE